MKLQKYFPVRIGDQVVWLRNFQTKLPNHVTLLGLDPAEVTAILLDVANAIYALEAYRGALAAATDAGYQRIDDALFNATLGGNIVWLGFTPPSGAPAAVPFGVLTRLFAYITETLRTAPAYDTAIGQDLGIEGIPAPAPVPAETTPDFTIRSTSGGKAEVVWTKGQFDGVKLEFDLGTAGMRTDMDLRPNYTLNWLPPTGTSAIIKVRLCYLYKGEEFGNWSPWQQWTLTGA